MFFLFVFNIELVVSGMSKRCITIVRWNLKERQISWVNQTSLVSAGKSL